MNRLSAVHVVACVGACAFGWLLTDRGAGLHQLAGAPWCIAATVAYAGAIATIGVLGLRSIRGGPDPGAAMMSAAMAPTVVGLAGAVVALTHAPRTPGAEGTTLLSIEIATSALWYALAWSAAALLATRVAVACAARAAVERAQLGPLRTSVMTSGRVVAALLGPALASLVLFVVDAGGLPAYWATVWKGHLTTTAWGLVVALSVTFVTAVPIAGDLRLLARVEGRAAPAEASWVGAATVAVMCLFLQTALVVWGLRPFERDTLQIPPGVMLAGIAAGAVLLVAELVPVWMARPSRWSSGWRRLNSAPVGATVAGCAAVLSAVVIVLGSVDWKNAPNFPAVVVVRATRVRAVFPGQLEIIVELTVENLLDQEVRVDGATGSIRSLENDTREVSLTLDAALPAHQTATFQFPIPLVREDLVLPNRGDDDVITAGEVVVTDGSRRGTVPFLARGTLTDADRRALFAGRAGGR